MDQGSEADDVNDFSRFEDIHSWIESIGSSKASRHQLKRIEKWAMAVQLGVICVEMSYKAKCLDKFSYIGCVEDI